MEEDRAVAKFFGLMLMAVGGLIAALCGLCSLTFLAGAVISMVRSPGSMVMVLPMIAVFGGVPGAIGLGLFFWGRNLWQGRRKAP
jgi:hypothetical protein